jgi:hypothetical protein
VTPRRPPALGYLWRHHRPAVIALALALVIALGFAVRLGMSILYWSDPAHRDQQIAGWMTPGYIARSWDVPPEVIRAVLPAPAATRRSEKPTLTRIAETEGLPLPDLIARVEAAIAGARAE